MAKKLVLEYSEESVDNMDVQNMYNAYTESEAGIDVSGTDTADAQNDVFTGSGENNVLCGCEVFNMKPDEAYVQSMMKFARLNLPEMMKWTGHSLEELVSELDLYQNPVGYDAHQDEYRDWMSQAEYLSSKHWYKAISDARKMHSKYGRFQKNIELLLANKPGDGALTVNDLPMGNKIIPPDIYGEIIREMYDLSNNPIVRLNKDTGNFTIEYIDPIPYVTNEYTYGVVGAMTAEKITDCLMNGRDIVVYDKEVDYTTRKAKNVRNKNNTLAAIEKSKDILARYRQVLRSKLLDQEIYMQLMERYYKSIGGFLDNKVDISWVKPEGLVVPPYQHQRVGIAHILTQEATMLVWDTGSGKSLAMIAAAMELRRMNIAPKSLFVIPNGSLENFYEEALKYYPYANFLVIFPKQFTKKKSYYLDEIRFGDYDAVFMASSTYDLIDMSHAYYVEKVKNEIRELKRAEAAAKDGADKRILKAKIKFKEDKLETLRLQEDKETDCFEDLNISAIFMDEAQHYKNAYLSSGYANISGMTLSASEKCIRNMEKIHYTLHGKPGRIGRVVFATATPLTTSIAEEYVFQKYLQEDTLQYLNINSFKDWLSIFTEAFTKPYIDQDVQHMSMRTRLHFHNLTDLHQMIGGFCDFHHVRKDELKIPECDGYQDIVVLATKEEQQVYADIAQKLKEVKEGIIDIKEYNSLKATMEGRLTAMDIRMTRPAVVPEENTTKEEYCAREVMRFYQEYPGTTQLIFCDLGVPKDEFNVYEQLQRDLIIAGIPAEEISFIQEGSNPEKKRQLLCDFNEGKIRVLIGSSERLGTGLNLQKRLIAIHHYDCPWSPASLRQRNGRILRPGNQNEKVYILRYLKQKSFDAYIWQNVAAKMHFITEFNSPTLNEEHRDMEDIVDNELSYGEAIAIALDNPQLKRYTELTNEIARTRLACKKRIKELQELQQILVDTPYDIEREEQTIQKVTKDIDYYKEHKLVLSNEVREDFGQKLLDEMVKGKHGEKTREFTYQGFQIIVPVMDAPEKAYVKIKGISGAAYKVYMDAADTALGACKVLDFYLGQKLLRIKKRHEDNCTENIHRLKQANEELLRGNPYMNLLDDMEFELRSIEDEIEQA